MNPVIAFCTDVTVFNENRILDENIAKNFPGALWVTRFSELAREHGVEVITGDIAILRIKEGTLDPSEILVIQEENCYLGFALLEMGAEPFLLFCAESPIYAGNFYANLLEISVRFKNRILFRGVFKNTFNNGVNHVLYFPSFSQGAKDYVVEWSDRRFMVMVAANKYWKPNRSILRKAAIILRNIIVRRKTYISNEIKLLQLHDRRLELIEYFGHRNNLDLYGMYWDSLSNLPEIWRKRLGKIISNLNPTSCNDKQSVIANYKFAICFENMSYPGYVTEKIIDCFRAGVIPLYFGAPDISDYVPKASFIDLREYADLDALNEKLNEITADAAVQMINVARTFLASDAGTEYSYEGFARNVLRMVNNYE